MGVVLTDRLRAELGQREAEVDEVLVVGRDRDVDVVHRDRRAASGGGKASHQDVADPVRSERREQTQRIELLSHRYPLGHIPREVSGAGGA